MRATLTQLFVWFVFFSSSLVLGAPGDVDPAFAYPRPAVLEPDSTNAIPLADGFLVIKSRNFGAPGVDSTLEVTRIDEDGRVVPSFGSGGTVRITLPGAVNVSTDVKGLPDGSMLVAGFQHIAGATPDTVAAIVRLDANGHLDSGFGLSGIATFDVPGQVDRVGAIDTLADGRILAGVWSRMQADPYGDCSNDRISLVRLNPNGTAPEVIYYREKNQFADNGCRNVMTLQVMADQRFYFGSHVETVVFDSPATTGWRPVRPLGCCYGPFAVFDALGVVWSQQFLGGPLLDSERLPAYIYDDNYGASDRMLSYTLAGMGFPRPRTASLLVPDGNPPTWYLGFSSDGGVAGIAKVRTDGVLDTGWAGGAGVVRISGTGRPNAFANEGLANDVRLISVRPGGETVVVVTADGVVERRFLKSGPAHGQIRFAVDNATDVQESRGVVHIRVQRLGGTDGAVGVDYTVGATLTDCQIDACARPGTDFGASSGRLEWADGDGSDRTITVAIINDTKQEPTEFLDIELTAPRGGTSIGTGSRLLEINILDDDPASPSAAGGGSPGQGGSGGGGSTGVGTLCLLLLAIALQRKTNRLALIVHRAAPAGVALSTIALLLPSVGRAAGVPGDVDASFVYPTPQVLEPDSTNAIPLADGFLVIKSRNFGAPGVDSTLEVTRIDEDGRIVPTYGTAGTVTIRLPGATNVATAVKRLPSGAVLLGGFRSDPGSSDHNLAVLVQLDPDGRLDSAFGNGGIAAFSVDGDLARVAAIDTVYGDAILAAVWSRTEIVPHDCSYDRVTLFQLSMNGAAPAPIYSAPVRTSFDWTCRGTVSLRFLDSYAYYGFNSICDDSALLADARELVLLGGSTPCRRWSGGGIFSLEVPGYPGFGRLGFASVGPTEADTRFAVDFDPPLDLNSGSSQSSVISLGKRAGYRGAVLPTALTADRKTGAWFLGFANDFGEAGLAKFRADGKLDESWGGGDGVVPINGSGRPGARDGVLNVSEGLATDVRMVSVRPSENVVVVTADGIVRRFMGPSADVPAGLLMLRPSSTTVTESNPRIALQVYRIGDSKGDVGVAWEAFVPSPCDSSTGVGCVDASRELATPGSDFVVASGRLDWSDGDTMSREIAVSIVDDNLYEPTEKFYVRLKDASGGTIVAGLAEITITNDDPPATSAGGAAGGAGGGSHSGGGGALGPLLVAMLGLLRLLSRRIAP